jgi:hypothetical protein
MWDTIMSALAKPDTWTIVIGILYALGIGTARFIMKKFGLKVRISLKPAAPPIEPSHVSNLIDQELKDWKSKYSTLEALLEVSRSQWTEKIEELTIENAKLKTERGNQETKEEGGI